MKTKILLILASLVSLTIGCSVIGSVNESQSKGNGDKEEIIKMSFKNIPTGTFTMGSPSNELGRSDDEVQHQVTLTQGFQMEVQAVMER